MNEKAMSCDLPKAYVMSNSQLNDLWHYDMWLASILMDLPLRRCSAVPVASSDHVRAMAASDFLVLKEQIRQMWINASNLFTLKRSFNGWGLFFKDNAGSHSWPSIGSKPLPLGWIAVAPCVGECPTAHRYLRSPCGSEEERFYLGGPVSMANYDEVDRVSCMRSLSCNEPLRCKMLVSKIPRRKVEPGIEVLWSYGFCRTDQKPVSFHRVDEWCLDCCSEAAVCVTVAPTFGNNDEYELSDSSSTPGLAAKKRRVLNAKPLKSSRCIRSFKPCTYCGVNMADNVSQGQQQKVKCHWALKHADELCKEMGMSHSDAVLAKDFIKHLDKVCNVYNCLHNHNYKVVPACNFFQIMDMVHLRPSASQNEKAAVFNSFLTEGANAFQKYEVLYLKGISMPTKYEDLLPQPCSKYSSRIWLGDPPSTNNFSINAFKLTEDEVRKHTADVSSHVTNVVLGWMNVHTP